MKKIKVFYKGMYNNSDCEHYIYAKNRDDYLVINYRKASKDLEGVVKNG